MTPAVPPGVDPARVDPARVDPARVDPPEAELGAWLRRAHPGAPVELVTRLGAVPLSARQWLALVEAGAALFAPDWRRALDHLDDGRPDR